MQTACPYHTAEVHKAISAREFLTELRTHARVFDLLVLLAIPLFLFAAQVLPPAAREELALAYHRPTLTTMVTAHFVHANWQHFLSNLGAYTLVAVTGYVVSLLTDRRRHFLTVFVVVILTFPLGLSMLSLQLRSAGVARGFSGIVMALLGYLVLIQIGYFALRFSPAAHLDHAPGIFLLCIAAIAVLTGPSTQFVRLFVGGTLLLAVLYLLPVIRASSIEGVLTGVGQTGYFETALFGAVTSAWIVLTTFSLRSGQATVIIDQTSHLFGFSAGFIFAYIVLRTDCSFAHVCHCAAPGSDCTLHASRLTRSLRWLLIRIGYC